MAFSTTINGITEDSQQCIDIYLQSKGSSARTIISALRRLIIDDTKKNNIMDINYDDYCTHVKPYQSSQAILQREFIKYLYAYDILKNKEGFDREYWNPEEIRNNFESGKKGKEKEEYKASLTFEQIEKIRTFLSGISELDFDNMRLALAFYLCFYTDIDNVVTLREADAKNYKAPIWTIDGSDYNIPDRYEPLIIDMQRTQYSGLSRINAYITQLGEHVGIKGLMPKQITKSRKQLQQTCFQCGKVDYVFANRWEVINGIILCKNCAQKIIAQNNIKKNYKIGSLESYDIDIITEEEKISNAVATTPFNELDAKFDKKFDYAKINEFLSYIGKRGEKFVYEFEKNKLRDSKYYELIDPTPAQDHTKGFDIYSFEKNGTPVMIEVKTTTGDVNDAFEMTNNELSVAEDAWNHKKLYKIYRIGNILSKNPTLVIYDNISKKDFDVTGIVYMIKRI